MKKHLKKKLEKYSIVSFDIFDTLIERDVKIPTDIFKRVAEEHFDTQDKREAFFKNRIWAEHEARTKRVDGEVTLEEIYESLQDKYDEVLAARLKDSEIEEEWKACKQKESMVAIYKHAIDKAQKVYLISDMYLPKAVIDELLKKCAIEDYDKLYISNEYRANKISGELFNIVCEENQLRKDDWLHIGDSFKADFKGAHRSGITSVLIYRRGQIKNRLRKFFKG